MKKILLGTSALIGAATLFAGAALASDPTVTIGGFSTFEAGWEHSDFTNYTSATNNGQADKNHGIAFRNDNEIHFNVAGKTDQGLGYGAEIDLQADINGADLGSGAPGASNSGLVARRTYGWLQGDQWGHFEYGSNDSSARNLKVDASNIARATGGIDGDYVFFANVNSVGGLQASAGTFNGSTTGNTNLINSNASRGNFITAPRLPVEAGPASSFASDVWGNDTKVTYYTPRYQGFQLGVSYTPELVDRGELTDTAVATSGYGAANIWSGGLNYEGQYDQVGIAAAATGEIGKSDDAGPSAADLQNIQAWNAGAKLAYMGWSLAGSYGDWRDSLAANGTSADYWTGGIAYETGPIGASVTYLGSETNFTNEDNKFQDVSVGVDYKLAPGLTPFIEYTWFDINPTGTAATANSAVENKGNVVIIGSQLSF